MARIAIGTQGLTQEIESIPSDKVIGAIGAFFYEGKQLTAAHYVNFSRMKLLADVTFVALYNNSFYTRTEEEINNLISDFSNSNQNIIVDFCHIQKEVFFEPPRYSPSDISSIENIMEMEEWKWYNENTDIVSLFESACATKFNTSLHIILHPKEVIRLKIQADAELDALKGRKLVWFRGMTDFLHDLKWTGKYLFPNLSNSTLYTEYKRELDSGLFSKRIYLPCIMFPTGRAIHNSNLLTDKISQHIFLDMKTYDYSNSTIEDLRSFITSKIPEGNGYVLCNMEGKIPTTNDLINKRVFLIVFGLRPDMIYEPGGEIMLIGMSDDEIFEIDYETGISGFKKVEGLANVTNKILSIYNETCLAKTTVNEVNDEIKAALYNEYSAATKIA